MRRLLIALVASLVLGLVGGVAPAWATLVPPPSVPDTSQTATQSNDGSNEANQSATSEPVVVSGPNVAIANGDSCSPCGGSGTTTQNSGNNVDASSSNTATQSNNQANQAGQTQAVDGGGSGDTAQSADQSNTGDNTANQTAKSEPVVVSGPNVAVLNSGDVNQNSGNNVDASSSNNASQTNNQSNSAGQSQTVAGDDCCSSNDGASQSASQSNDGSNEANQSATSRPVVVSGGNYAIANKGDVNQNSGNNVDASSSNTANQSNNQSNSAGQSQTVADGGSGCCSDHSDTSQSADQSNSGSNTANQTAKSEPVVVSGPNIAAFNGWGHDSCNPCDPCNPCGGDGGTVNQNSGNNVWAPASNTANQTNNQSNALGQTQTVTGGGSGCCSATGDVTQEARQSNYGDNEANQTATSAPWVESGKNVALFNHGDVTQNSGNNVWAPASNAANQSNNQSNNLGQTQTVDRGGCCPLSDCNSCNPCDSCNPCNPCPPPPCEPCEPRCEPNPCEPKPCEPKPCEPNPCEPTREAKSNSGRGNLSETDTGTRQSDSSTLKNPHEGETGPGDHPTDDRDPGNSGLHNRGGD
jgi:hypothetical protein